MRLNREDRWYKDKRRTALAARVAPLLSDPSMIHYLVDGIADHAWSIGQKYWLDGQRLIPMAEWQEEGVPNAFLEVGLAVVVNVPTLGEKPLEAGDARIVPFGACSVGVQACSGKTEHTPNMCSVEWVYVRGLWDAYKTFFERRAKRQSAGQASAAARKAKNGTAVPNNARNRRQANAEHLPNTCSETTEQPPNATEPSYSFSGFKKRESAHAREAPPGGNSSTPPEQVPADQLAPCEAEWGRTLKHHGSTKLAHYDREAIAALIALYGPQRTRYALAGVRSEVKTHGKNPYDPARGLAPQRLAPPGEFSRYEAAGHVVLKQEAEAAERERKEAEERKRQEAAKKQADAERARQEAERDAELAAKYGGKSVRTTGAPAVIGSLGSGSVKSLSDPDVEARMKKLRRQAEMLKAGGQAAAGG